MEFQKKKVLPTVHKEYNLENIYIFCTMTPQHLNLNFFIQTNSTISLLHKSCLTNPRKGGLLLDEETGTTGKWEETQGAGVLKHPRREAGQDEI